jgi:ATP-binding cassette, subfamily B, bacterial MsbA
MILSWPEWLRGVTNLTKTSVGRCLRQQRAQLCVVFFLSITSILIQLPLAFVTRYLVDDVLPHHRLSALHAIVGLLLLYMVIKGAVDSLYSWLATAIRERCAMALQMDLVRHVHALGVPYAKDKQSGYLAARIMSDAIEAADIPIGIVIPFIRDTLMLVVAVYLLFRFEWHLLLLVAGLIPAVYAVFHISHRRMRGASLTLQEATSLLWGDYHQSIAAMELVVSCQAEEGEAKRLAHSMNRKFRAAMRVALVGSVTAMMLGWLSGIAALIVLEIGGVMVIGGTLTLGSLIAFNVLLGYMISPLQGIVSGSISMQRSLAAVERLTEISAAIPAVLDAEKPLDLPLPLVSLRFEGVSFGYDRTRPILQDLRFTLSCGQMILIVGKNGVGKSTLVRLIPRFYDPDCGRILLNDIDLRSIRQQELRSVIAIVPQSAMLISGTIKENVCFGIPATSKSDLEYASWTSTMDELLERWPNGWETMVGDGGTKLSGGERQRVALARALVRRPSLLILDEAASELDLIAERELYSRLRHVPWQMSIIIIDHKMTAAKSADVIIALEQGRVVSQGTHDELLTQSRYYQELFWCKGSAHAVPRSTHFAFHVTY